MCPKYSHSTHYCHTIGDTAARTAWFPFHPFLNGDQRKQGPCSNETGWTQALRLRLVRSQRARKRQKTSQPPASTPWNRTAAKCQSAYLLSVSMQGLDRSQKCVGDRRVCL